MISADVEVEEVATVEKQNYPQQIFRRFIRQVDPEAKGEGNQEVYEKRKRLFLDNKYIWYVLIVIEVLLTFRVILKASGADSNFGFPRIIYAITDLFVFPFSGVSGNYASDEWSTIFAGVVYLAIAWGLIYLFRLIYPVTPRRLERQ
jgi:hypothetical protein